MLADGRDDDGGGRAYAAFVLIGLVIGAALLLAIAVTPYRRDRLQAYLHPATSNPSQAATGYQVCQAIVAVGSGGLIGLGLGSSVQAYGYPPEAPTTPYLCNLCREFGFIGSIVFCGFGTLFTGCSIFVAAG